MLELLEILNKKQQQQQQQQMQEHSGQQQQQLPQHTSSVIHLEEAKEQPKPEELHGMQQKHRMELSQIELIYRAEGNANLVLALPQFKKVLRLPKIQKQQQQQDQSQLELQHIELLKQRQQQHQEPQYQETQYSQKYPGLNKQQLRQPQQHPELEREQQRQMQEPTNMTLAATIGQEQQQHQLRSTNGMILGCIIQHLN